MALKLRITLTKARSIYTIIARIDVRVEQKNGFESTRCDLQITTMADGTTILRKPDGEQVNTLSCLTNLY